MGRVRWLDCAGVALEGLGAGVGVNVSRQIAGLRQGLSAVGALEGPGAGATAMQVPGAPDTLHWSPGTGRLCRGPAPASAPSTKIVKMSIRASHSSGFEIVQRRGDPASFFPRIPCTPCFLTKRTCALRRRRVPGLRGQRLGIEVYHRAGATPFGIGSGFGLRV